MGGGQAVFGDLRGEGRQSVCRARLPWKRRAPLERLSDPTEKRALSHRGSLKEQEKKKREREPGGKIPQQATGTARQAPHRRLESRVPCARHATKASPHVCRRTQGFPALSPQAEHAAAPAPSRGTAVPGERRTFRGCGRPWTSVLLPMPPASHAEHRRWRNPETCRGVLLVRPRCGRLGTDGRSVSGMGGGGRMRRRRGKPGTVRGRLQLC